MEDVEPWEIAAERGAGVALTLVMVLVSLAMAVTPAKRLLVLTGLRLTIAGLCALVAVSLPLGLLSKGMWFASSAFVLLAALSCAAHVESVVLGPLVDRLTGSDR